MLHARSAACALVGLGLLVAGCRSDKDHLDRGRSPQAQAAVQSGTGGSGPQLVAGRVTQVTPDVGQLGGGTAVTVRGSGFAAGVSVEFGGLAASDVRVQSATELTCTAPAHAAGLVDVRVELPDGTYGVLPQGFRYDAAASGPSARVADTGDPAASAQAMLELINRARRDPTAEGVRLGIDLSGYAAQAPVSLNAQLTRAADAHCQDMATRGFFDHLNPDGVNANGRVLDSGYPLHADFGTSRTINATENIAAGVGAVLDTPGEVHAALVIDRGVAGLVHRRAILGDGPTYRSREVGLALLTGSTNYTTQEFAYSTTDRPLVLGVAFRDADQDGIMSGSEGRGQLAVTLTDAQGQTVGTQTGTAGGFAFEVLRGGTFTLTVDGQSTQVVVAGESVKVDLRDGALIPY